MNEATATQVTEIGRRVTADLNEMVRIALEAGPDDGEFRDFRRTVGRIMGAVYLDVLKPIYESFPHLTPEDLRPPGPAER